MTLPRVVDLTGALADVDEHWSPRTVGVVNDYDVRVAKVLGEFARHRHPDTDEFFQVLSGELVIRLDAGEVRLGPGQSCVVPRGVPHQPVAETETLILLFEPSGTVNTGDAPGPLTAPRRMG
jgi:mannose-6-phosphate isomerase-like protein (cupin superfamily)